MKRVICFLLCLCLLVGLSGCGRDKVNLPWDLQFGQTHTEVIDIVTKNDVYKSIYEKSFEPEDLKEDGYHLTLIDDPPSWDFLHSKELTSILEDKNNSDFSGVFILGGLTFNHNKELYEIHWFVDDNGNDEAETLFELVAPEMTSYYNKAFGKEGRLQKYANAEVLIWENDEFAVELCREEIPDNIGAIIAITFRSLKYGVN